MEAHRLKMRHSSKDPNWRTPTALFTKLFQVFPITLDLAAESESRMAQDYFGPDHHSVENRDALAIDWWQSGHLYGYLNPPYSVSGIKELRETATELDEDFERQIRALRVENWAEKAFDESLKGFYTIGVFPYAPQTEWFRRFVMGHATTPDGLVTWRGHAALDYWRLPHRISFLTASGERTANANTNHCIILWGPNPGFIGPWVPSGRYWSYR